MLIKNGTIIDGTGKERFRGDVRIEGDKIKEVGNLKPRRREKTIKADNQFVVPGFVDIINRSDIHTSIFRRSGLRSLIKQGVTTILGGSCGASLAPLAGKEAIRSIQKWQDISRININWASTEEFLEEVGRHKIDLNFATLTGHATLRRGLVGDYFGDLKEEDVKKMEYLLARSIDEGSFGLSMGLEYSHERTASAKELERLLTIVKGKEGLYTAHLRDEGLGLVSSVEEIVGAAKRIGVSSHISHFKALGRKAWGEFPKALDVISNAKSDGVPIDFDIYPYKRTASVLYLLLPDWASEGGKAKVLQRLRDDKTRQKIRDELKEQAGELGETVIGVGDTGDIFAGKTLEEIAKNQDTSVVDALLNVILASEDRVMGFLPISERNMKLAMKSSLGFISSDGAGYRIKERDREGLVHPRSFGTFPRFLGRYVRKMNIISWEEAIQKITTLPAQKIGLEKRGRIEKGYFADITVFDPARIRDRATFKNPFQYSRGVNYVIVNGGSALVRGKFTKKQWGRVLRK
jgi:N-acyl-D-amino-acid deacylase